jgi:hypothetical protein
VKFRVDDHLDESIGYPKQSNEVDAFEDQNRGSFWPS